MAEQYYIEDATAVPARVMRDILGQQVPAWIAWPIAGLLRLRGKLHWPLMATYGVAFPVGETDVAREDMPPEAIAQWAIYEEPLIDLGFRPLRYRRVKTIGATRKAYAVWIDAANTTIGNLAWTATTNNGIEQQKINLEFDSFGSQDPEYTTGVVAAEDVPSSQVIDLDFVDLVMLDERIGIAEAYSEHLARIDGKPVNAMSDEGAIMVLAERSSRRMRRLLEQGILRELSPAEIAAPSRK